MAPVLGESYHKAIRHTQSCGWLRLALHCLVALHLQPPVQTSSGSLEPVVL